MCVCLFSLYEPIIGGHDLLSFTQFQALVFRAKPTVPAVSRWTTCGSSSRYFLWCCGYHNILWRAFLLMHVSPAGGNDLPQVMDERQEECNELVSAVELVGDATESEHFLRVLRIKSFKVYEWLQSEKTAYNLLTCVLATQMLERVMWCFMGWQKSETWMTLENAPLIRMSNMHTSPAASAIRELSAMMQTGVISAFSSGNVTIDEMTQGSWP